MIDWISLFVGVAMGWVFGVVCNAAGRHQRVAEYVRDELGKLKDGEHFWVNITGGRVMVSTDVTESASSPLQPKAGHPEWN